MWPRESSLTTSDADPTPANRARERASVLAVSLAAIVTVLLSAAASARELDFEEAKSRADESEAGLGAKETRLLVEAQGEFAGAAFAQCIRLAGAPPPRFIVVVELGPDGRVENSWLRGESRFARCFRERMVAEFFFRPSSSPFFTSFEYVAKP